jgi:predicted RND superfamily exporter protein
MTTLTIKINENSKKGKAFLEFAQTFFADSKEIEITKNEDKIIYNPEFVEKIKKAEKSIKEGKGITVNPNDIWGSIL